MHARGSGLAKISNVCQLLFGTGLMELTHVDAPVQIEIAREDDDVVGAARRKSSPSLSERWLKSKSSERLSKKSSMVSLARRSQPACASGSTEGEMENTHSYKTYCMFVGQTSSEDCSEDITIKFCAQVEEGYQRSSLDGWGCPRDDAEVGYSCFCHCCPCCFTSDPGCCCVSFSMLACCPCWGCICLAPKSCTEYEEYRGNETDYKKACHPWFYYSAYLQL